MPPPETGPEMALMLPGVHAGGAALSFAHFAGGVGMVARSYLTIVLSCGCCFVVLLQNDFTPEQEEEVRRENQWAFD